MFYNKKYRIAKASVKSAGAGLLTSALTAGVNQATTIGLEEAVSIGGGVAMTKGFERALNTFFGWIDDVITYVILEGK